MVSDGQWLLGIPVCDWRQRSRMPGNLLHPCVLLCLTRSHCIGFCLIKAARPLSEPALSSLLKSGNGSSDFHLPHPWRAHMFDSNGTSSAACWNFSNQHFSGNKNSFSVCGAQLVWSFRAPRMLQCPDLAGMEAWTMSKALLPSSPSWLTSGCYILSWGKRRQFASVLTRTVPKHSELVETCGNKCHLLYNPQGLPGFSGTA